MGIPTGEQVYSPFYSSRRHIGNTRKHGNEAKVVTRREISVSSWAAQTLDTIGYDYNNISAVYKTVIFGGGLEPFW